MARLLTCLTSFRFLISSFFELPVHNLTNQCHAFLPILFLSTPLDTLDTNSHGLQSMFQLTVILCLTGEGNPSCVDVFPRFLSCSFFELPVDNQTDQGHDFAV